MSTPQVLSDVPIFAQRNLKTSSLKGLCSQRMRLQEDSGTKLLNGKSYKQQD